MNNVFGSLSETIELVPIETLCIYENNARRHTKKQIRKLADTILATGWAAPIVVDEENLILAGAGRHAAARLIGLTHVPVARMTGLSLEQKTVVALADNRLHDESFFDHAALKIELASLADAGIDLGLTGFDSLESDRILSLEAFEEKVDDDVVHLPSKKTVFVSRRGDLWHIGEHRLAVDDARDMEIYERLLGGERAQLIFTDPPYGCKIEGNVSGLGKTKHKDFLVGAGEVPLAEFGATLLRPAFKCMAAHSLPGALAFICSDWRAAPYLHDAAQGVFHKQLNLIVWGKTNAGLGTTYRSAHELIHLYKVSEGKHINNFSLGEGGRHRSNLWIYPSANVFRKGRLLDLGDHSTVKPRKLVADAIIDCSTRGGLVLDPFAGSGTTLSAAHSVGRRAYGIEIDPQYADVILRRVSEFVGEPALLNGETPFDDVARARLPRTGDKA